MTEQEIKDKLKLILWDSPATVNDAYDLLMNDSECEGIAKHTLFQKILSSFHWYTAKEMIPEKSIPYAFSDEVVSGLYPPCIRDKYRYAKRFL